MKTLQYLLFAMLLAACSVNRAALPNVEPGEPMGTAGMSGVFEPDAGEPSTDDAGVVMDPQKPVTTPVVPEDRWGNPASCNVSQVVSYTNFGAFEASFAHIVDGEFDCTSQFDDGTVPGFGNNYIELSTKRHEAPSEASYSITMDMVVPRDLVTKAGTYTDMGTYVEFSVDGLGKALDGVYIVDEVILIVDTVPLNLGDRFIGTVIAAGIRPVGGERGTLEATFNVVMR